MKRFSLSAAIVVVVIAAWASSAPPHSQPAAAATTVPIHGAKVAPAQYFTNLAATVKGGQIVVSWSLHSYNYKMQVHVTRTPAFDPSFQPAGYALLLPPVLPLSEAETGHTDESFTDIGDTREGVTYSYTVCAFWTENVYGNGSDQPPTAHVPLTSCAGPVTARLGYSPVRLQPLQIAQPTNVKAVRLNGSTVGLSWSTTGAGTDTAHLYLMVDTGAAAPTATFTTPGWGKYAAVSPTSPQKYNLTVPGAPSGQHNYYMVCAANGDDKATVCSTAVQETGLPFAPAPLAH
jgi:hypothetical protein